MMRVVKQNLVSLYSMGKVCCASPSCLSLRDRCNVVPLLPTSPSTEKQRQLCGHVLLSGLAGQLQRPEEEDGSLVIKPWTLLSQIFCRRAVRNGCLQVLGKTVSTGFYCNTISAGYGFGVSFVLTSLMWFTSQPYDDQLLHFFPPCFLDRNRVCFSLAPTSIYKY